MRVTIGQVRTAVEYINKRYGTKLSVERWYNYYNVYVNGGTQVATGCKTAREAYNVVKAFERGLNEMQAIEAAQFDPHKGSSYKGEPSEVIEGLQAKSEPNTLEGWADIILK